MPRLPFTHEQFMALFATYNDAVWPAQALAYALALAVVGVAIAAPRWGSRFVALALAAMWGWTGVVYHWLHFADINRAAFAFGALFVAQAAVFAFAAAHGGLRIGGGHSVGAVPGWFLVTYAMVVYPLLGLAMGQAYPRMPMFGITPCPVTLFTFGILLLASQRVPWWMLVVPAAWSLIGGSAAVLLGVPQDWALLASGLAVIPIALAGRRSAPRDTALRSERQRAR